MLATLEFGSWMSKCLSVTERRTPERLYFLERQCKHSLTNQQNGKTTRIVQKSRSNADLLGHAEAMLRFFNELEIFVTPAKDVGKQDESMLVMQSLRDPKFNPQPHASTSSPSITCIAVYARRKSDCRSRNYIETMALWYFSIRNRPFHCPCSCAAQRARKNRGKTRFSKNRRETRR